MVCIDETIETKPMRQQFPVVLFIMLYKVVLDFEIIKTMIMTIQMNYITTEQRFAMGSLDP